MEYIERNTRSLAIKRHDGTSVSVPAVVFRNAIDVAHKVIDQFKDFGVDVFAVLGMRNLSAFIGELYAAAAIKCSDDLFVKNPHQDGYPDLLLMDPIGKRLWNDLKQRAREKAPFSPFAAGGIEVKATCGSVPTPAQCLRRGCEKPGLGDQRISIMQGYDWKAHHRETNNLAGILWDFIDGVPRIAAVFYSDSLTTEDWGEIVKPKENGGRTTSVSIMNRGGIRRMYSGWLFVLKQRPYLRFIDQYNGESQLMARLNSGS